MLLLKPIKPAHKFYYLPTTQEYQLYCEVPYEMLIHKWKSYYPKKY